MTTASGQLTAEWTALLKAIPFLSPLPEKTLEERLVLGKIPQAQVPASLVEVADGDHVIREGEFGDTFYVVVAGTFVVEMWTDEGLVQEVSRIGRGSWFGELAMIGYGTRAASVRADGPGCQVLEIAKGPFDRILKDDRTNAVRSALEALYAERTISRFVEANDALRGLSEADRKDIVTHGKLVRLEALQDVYKAGDVPRSFYLVRQGFLKAWRTEGQVESILAYLRDKDFFGDLELIEGRGRTATVTTMEPVELVEVPRAVFASIYQRYPDVIRRFRRYEIDRRAQGAVGSKTGMMFVKDLIESGMGQARSALIIDMDLCTRCGNCVQACSDIHDGYSRLIRRGKKLTRRDHDSGDLQHLFFPNSCVHCRTPECMTGCPVGSIARDKDGEVYIKDHCVGCGACAKGCEFGNISMVIIGDKKAAKPQRKASKCDICKGFEQANCVYNCPQGAIIRVDPNAYFEELQRPVDLVDLAQRPSGR